MLNITITLHYKVNVTGGHFGTISILRLYYIFNILIYSYFCKQLKMTMTIINLTLHKTRCAIFREMRQAIEANIKKVHVAKPRFTHNLKLLSLCSLHSIFGHDIKAPIEQSNILTITKSPDLSACVLPKSPC